MFGCEWNSALKQIPGFNWKITGFVDFLPGPVNLQKAMENGHL
jgi:hypothetical protein